MLCRNVALQVVNPLEFLRKSGASGITWCDQTIALSSRKGLDRRVVIKGADVHCRFQLTDVFEQRTDFYVEGGIDELDMVNLIGFEEE